MKPARAARTGVGQEDGRGQYYMTQSGPDTIARAAREQSKPTVGRQELDDALEEIRDYVVPNDGE